MAKAERSPLGTDLSVTIHRIKGRKEATTLLNRCGVGIPCTDVHDLNSKWAKSITMEHNKMLPPGFIQGRSVHITFDNSTDIDMLTNHSSHYWSGEPFSTIHGDFITETTINQEVNVRGGPMQGEYSTS